MKKRIAFLLLCAFLFALLAGCGKDTGSPQTDSSSDSQTQSQADGQINGRTLFIYMCGSNLESRQGLASKNIDELLSANVSSDLNIVLQTGGAKTWRHHGINAKQSQRYEIKDKKLTLLEELDQKNMGSAETLTDFLKWGQEKYPTSHNMLILWDHGGGSVKGVCFDENYNMDSLSLTELRTAFKDANLRQKFDILGFDACLMASLETAAITQDYAEYMIASEEIVPGGGWDYKTVAEACESGKNEIEIGRKICDSFMEKCKANEKELYSTLSVFDLAYTDPMLQCLVK
ncbi:MAG: clostripain-related cysteine peptidase, partial [bacterium]